MAPERPRGVTLLALYYVGVAVALTVLAWLAIYVVGVIPRAFEDFVGNPGALFGLAVLVSAVHGAAAAGLWVLHPWSRALVVGLSALGIATGMLALPLGVVAVVLNVVTVGYILDPRVRGAFRPKSVGHSKGDAHI